MFVCLYVGIIDTSPLMSEDYKKDVSVYVCTCVHAGID